MTIVGHLVWTKGLKGFRAEKHPESYMPPADAPPPVDRYELGPADYGLTIAILEVRFPCRAKLEDEARVKLEGAT
jgi:hypothetical protein